MINNANLQALNCYAWYTCNNHLYDISGNSRHGTINGCIPRALPNGQRGYYFDGSNDYADICLLPSITELTILVWYNSTQSTDNWGLINNYGGTAQHFILAHRSGGVDVFLDDGNTGNWHNSGKTCNDGNWHLIGFTYDNTTQELNILVDNITVLNTIYSGGTIDFTERSIRVGANRTDSSGYLVRMHVAGIFIFTKILTKEVLDPLMEMTQPSYLRISSVYKYEDYFTADTISNYTWTLNSASRSYDSVNNWIEIRTGNNCNAVAEWNINPISEGYAKIVYTKHADYPTDNSSYISFQVDENNYYLFGFRGSGYGKNYISKKIAGTVVDRKDASTSTDSNSEHIFEMWWSPTRLVLKHNGSLDTDLSTTNTDQLNPSNVKLRIGQSDIDWKMIYISKDIPNI